MSKISAAQIHHHCNAEISATVSPMELRGINPFGAKRGTTLKRKTKQIKQGRRRGDFQKWLIGASKAIVLGAIIWLGGLVQQGLRGYGLLALGLEPTQIPYRHQLRPPHRTAPTHGVPECFLDRPGRGDERYGRALRRGRGLYTPKATRLRNATRVLREPGM